MVPPASASAAAVTRFRDGFDAAEVRAYLDRGLAGLLDRFQRHGAKATFFVTGDFHALHSDWVARIHGAGHEIGYHTHTHPELTGPRILEREIAASAKFLAQYPPAGFRAPRLYLPGELLEVLKDHGFAYDSSTMAPPGRVFERAGLRILPVSSHAYFGEPPGLPRYPSDPGLGQLWREAPLGAGIMVSYLRRFYGGILRFYERRGAGCVFYLHLWQFEPWPGRSWSIWRDRLRRVHGLPLWGWLDALLERHRFVRMDALANERESGGPPAHCLTIDLENYVAHDMPFARTDFSPKGADPA